MKKILTLLLFGNLLLAFISCELFNNNDPYIIKAIEGSWKWHLTSGGFAGITTYADSVDYTRHLVINKDGKAIMYRNDKVTAVFNVKFENLEWLGRATYIFYKKNASILTYVSAFEEDKLVLSQSCEDCFRQIFKR